MCKRANEEDLEKCCEEIEDLEKKDILMMHKSIKRVLEEAESHRMHQGGKWNSGNGRRTSEKKMDGIHQRSICGS